MCRGLREDRRLEIREVPFIAMGGVYDRDDVDAANRVVAAAMEEGGNFFPLPEENEFQARLAEHEGARRAIAVNSCGTALDCCMMALGLREGDEAITTPMTFVCTAGTAVARGAKVVFADIDPVTLNLDPAEVRKRITPRTRVILPVHFAGLACDIDAFDRITEETGIPVVYDAAHAVGAIVFSATFSSASASSVPEPAPAMLAAVAAALLEPGPMAAFDSLPAGGALERYQSRSASVGSQRMARRAGR